MKPRTLGDDLDAHVAREERLSWGCVLWLCVLAAALMFCVGFVAGRVTS